MLETTLTKYRFFDLRWNRPLSSREGSYLLKVVLGEFVCNAQQLSTGVCVSEGPDA